MTQVVCNSIADREICHHCHHTKPHSETAECRERCYEPRTGVVVDAECEEPA